MGRQWRNLGDDGRKEWSYVGPELNINLKEKEMILQKTKETRDELTTNELDLVSGGAPGLGIGYGSNGGQTFISWGDGTGKGYYVMKEGQKGYTWVPN
jgi:hypothetical protein